MGYIALVDMGLMWRLATPTKEDREKPDKTKYTWGDYRDKLHDTVMRRHPNAETIILVNDPYNSEYSIKDSEKLRRSKGPAPNVFMSAGKEFPCNQTFKILMTKSENKTRLQAFIRERFSRCTKTIIYTVIGEYCHNLTTDTDMPEYLCNQAEADTAQFSILAKMIQDKFTQPFVLDTEDTDNYVQAFYVANKIESPLLIKRKRVFVSAKHLTDPCMVDTILPMYMLTGDDHNSGFYDKGKKLINDRMMFSHDARLLLESVGESLEMSEETADDMKSFVIKYVYNDHLSNNLAEARVKHWQSKSKRKFIRMPPDEESMYLQALRCNYLSYICKHFDLLAHPDPVGNGWFLQNGLCLPVKPQRPPLPRQVSVDITSDIETEDETDSEIESSDYFDSSDEDALPDLS